MAAWPRTAGWDHVDLPVGDPGHVTTERPGLWKLYAAVAAGWDDTVDLPGVDADPWTT